MSVKWPDGLTSLPSWSTPHKISGIDKDPVKLNAFKEIAENAKQLGVGISVVGVENEAQYKLLRDIDKNMLLQGYYFYKPLTRSDFISAIISYN